MALVSKPGRPMEEHEIRSVVESELRSSQGYVGGEISELRREALDYYFGEKFGNEIEGRSEYVSMDLQDVVEAIMPDLMEIFAAGDVVVEFEPTGMEDEAPAKQATDYVNYIWNRDNDGFSISYDWMKDALLQKNGIIRIDWEDKPEIRTETRSKVGLEELEQLLGDQDVEILEQEEVAPETPDEMMLGFGGPLFNLKIQRTDSRGKVTVQALPPEEFLISRRATSLDDAMLTSHKMEKTVSDLLEMGYPRELIDSIPSHDEQDYNEERVSRFNLDDEWPDSDDSPDYANRKIWLYDCFVLIDQDGDGIAELRNAVVAGPGYKIMPDPDSGELTLEVDDHPFVDITPIRMPHKWAGRSIHELVRDLQYLKSTIIRQLLDNMYLVNNQRSGVSENVDLDDWLTNRPGGAVRVRTKGPDVAGHFAPIVTPSIGNFAYPLLEYMDGVREVRTGVTRYNQGLDADSLNKTATGINLILGQTQKRLLLIARLFAETGFRKAFKKILRLTINHQDRERVIRLRNEWVPIDPKAWNADMDLTVRVGLGHGTKETRLGMVGRILEMQKLAIEFQGGVNGPLVTMSNLWEALRQFVNASGLKPARMYFTEPTPEVEQQMAQQPKPEDPRLVEAKLTDRREREKMQMEAQRDQAKMQTEAEIAEARMRMEHELKMAELRLKEREAELEMALKQREAAQDAALKSEKLDNDMEIQRKRAAERPNGGASS